MNEPPNSEETIVVEALRLAPEERATYLDQVTGGNMALRQRVESLLTSYQAGEFMEQVAAPVLQRTIALSVPLTEKAGDTIGRYKLLQQIGEGGCGVVYMAEQEEPVRRRVALKVIKAGMDTKNVIARFEAERQALALMDHSNIAKVLDAGATEAGRPYFVMELVRGMKITDYCDEAKLSIRARLDLFVQVCQAVQHAHQKGIIHRDLKPSNILVSIDNGVAVPKIIDFGIAKATGGQQLTDKTIFTAFEQFIGTPAYMSPEQAMLTNLDVDTRSDIYSLGVLLYEMLTGKTPFDSKELLAIGLDEIRRTICEKDPQRPSTRLSSLPENEMSTTAQRRGLEAPKLLTQLRGDLDWIVMKALEKDRTRRYETANGLAVDIQRHLNEDPVLARPASQLYQFQKLVRRNKLVFAAGTAVVASLLVVMGLSAWMFFRERAAKQEQVRLRQLAEANEKKAEYEAARSRATEWESSVSRFMADHNYTDVDAVLRNLLPPGASHTPIQAPLVAVRGYYLARRGRLREAVRDFSELIRLEPENVEHYFYFAPLLLINGDAAGYHSTCKEMLARFGAETNATTADYVVKSCCLLPPSDSDLLQIARQANWVLVNERDTSFTGGNMVNVLPWQHLDKGLAEYRLGHHQIAADLMRKTLGENLHRFNWDDILHFTAYTVLAMSEYRLGRIDDARAAMAKGAELSEAKLPHLESADLGRWHDLFVGLILMREAKAMIEGQPSTLNKAGK